MNTILIKQFLLDIGCDSNGEDHLFNTSKPADEARFLAKNKGTIIIHKGKIFCRTDDESLTEKIRVLYHNSNAEWFGEVDNLKNLERLLNEHNRMIVNYTPFFVPDRFVKAENPDIRFYEADEIIRFKDHAEFKEAFLFDEAYPDLLGASIEKDDKIVALAGLNRNGKHCLELGIQVLPEYRHQGLASRLIQAISEKASQRYPNSVITYGTQFTHTQSINVAIRSGFIHEWTEIVIGEMI